MSTMRIWRRLAFLMVFLLGAGALQPVSASPSPMTGSGGADAPLPPLPPAPPPVMGAEATAALNRIDPALRAQALAGGDAPVLLWVMASGPVEVARYGEVLASAEDEALGMHRFFVRVPASRLLKMAGMEEVVALVSIASKDDPRPPDPEAPGGTVHGVALDPEAKIDPALGASLRAEHEAARAVAKEEGRSLQAPVAPDFWFENMVQGVQATWNIGVHGFGNPAAPIHYAVIDSGVDFCNAALYGRWAVENSPSVPAYNGWPIAYDDHSAAEFIANYPAPGSGYGGNWGWYVNAGTRVAEGTFTDALYTRPFTTPGTSKSGFYYYGYHPDTLWHLMEPYGASPLILVADVATAGVYDTVYVDADWDGLFETAMNRANPAGCVDWRGPGGSGPDGVADDSYGMIYWISDGANPLPGVEWIYGGGTPVPPAGQVVLMMINDIYAPGGDHGTLCASSAAGGVAAGTFYDWRNIMPPGLAGSVSIVGGPASGGSLPGARIVAIGNTYAGGSSFNEYLFTLFGYDGLPGSSDDMEIVSLSFGSGSEDADAWDFQSEYLAHWNLQREMTGMPSPLYVHASGNGGHGYGTVNTPGPATGLSVGASTQYGPYKVWGFYEGVGLLPRYNYGDVQPWSNRGPTAMGTLAPMIVANGAWGSGAIPVNYATYVYGTDGAAAWDMWGGTSRATPVVAGMAALVYDAYWQGRGTYPDWREARNLLMDAAKDIGYDEFVAGSGMADAYRAAITARGDYGAYVEPAFYNAGSYPPGSGLRAESFAMGLLPGQSDVATFTVYNPYTASISLMMEDRALTEVGRYTFTLSTLAGDPVPSNYTYGAPDYLLDLTPLIAAHPTADLMIVRDTYPFEHFAADPTQPPTYTNRWIGAVYNVFDDGDGVWWNDLNANGRVEISPTVAAGSHELDAGDEYIRFTYAYLHGTMQEMRVQHPWARHGSMVWLGLSHVTSDGSATTHRIEVLFYEEQDWPFLSVAPTGLILSPGTPASPSTGVITATMMTRVRSDLLFTETWDSAAIPALPPGWSITDLTGGGGSWQTDFNTVNPPGGSPVSAPALVYFDSSAFPSGAEVRLQQTSGLDLSTLPPDAELELSLQLYHDTGASTAADRLQVQVSTDGGTTWEDVGAAIPRYDGTTGWQEHLLDLSDYVGESDVRLGFVGLAEGGNDLHLDDVRLYRVESLPPGLHTAHIVIHDPGVSGTFDPHDIQIPIVVQNWLAVDGDPQVGGTPHARTPYDNGSVVGAFSWGGSQESGDWRVFPFIVEGSVPVGAKLMVENVWEDYPTDLDTLLLDQVPVWDFSSAQGSPPPYPPNWFGPHTMDDLGAGSQRSGTAPNWSYHTDGGRNRELLVTDADVGLHVMLHQAVLYGGHQRAVPFTTTLAVASVQPNPLVIPPGLHDTAQTFSLTFKTGLAISEGLTMGAAFGWYVPTVLTRQVVVQDDPNDPTTASWLYPILLSDTYRLEVAITGATGPDYDLYVVRDVDMDGVWTAADQMVGASATATADEFLTLNEPEDGGYLIAVHGWSVVPSPGLFDIRIATVAHDGAMTPLSLPGSLAAGETATLTFRLARIPDPGSWEGMLFFGPPSSPKLFEVPVFIEEAGGVKSASAARVKVGDEVTFTIVLTDVAGTPLVWHLEDPVPDGFELVSVIGAIPITASGRTTLTWDSPLACQVQWIDATAGRAITLTDDGEAPLTMPFSFRLYALTSSTLTVGNNGGLLFGTAAGDLPPTNTALASTTLADALILPFWDDLDDSGGGVYASVSGTPPNRRFVVEWQDRPHRAGVGAATFEVILEEGSNDLYFLYRDTDFGDAAYDHGASATVGVRSRAAGGYFTEVSHDSPVIGDNTYIHLTATSPTSYTIAGSGTNCTPLHFGSHTITVVLRTTAFGTLTNTAIIRSGENTASRSASIYAAYDLFLPIVLRSY